MSSGRTDISNRTATGRVLDHGAQVVSWRPHGSADVFWLSERAIEAPGSAIRGGVPICFPWFGSGRSGDLKPSHGFARTSQWRRVEVFGDDLSTSVVHTLTADQVPSPNFPYPYRAVSTVRFGEHLSVAVEVANTGTVEFSFEIALHAYFAVGDVTAIRIEGLDGCSYYDKALDEHAVQRGDVMIAGEVDRVYRSSSAVRLVDPGMDRVITVTKTGSASTVIWNPWTDRARQLTDFGDDEWRSMVCVETGCIGDESVMLAPGQSHTVEMAVSLLGH